MSQDQLTKTILLKTEPNRQARQHLFHYLSTRIRQLDTKKRRHLENHVYQGKGPWSSIQLSFTALDEALDNYSN